jgi:hypothetical protein
MTAPLPSLRDPDTLHPLLRPIYFQHVDTLRSRGLIVVTVFCWRPCGAQEQLYQIGRRGIPGEKIVTNARGGSSWHNVERDGRPAALAYDLALMTSDGKRYLSDLDPAWYDSGLVAESLGLTWGGRSKSRDLGHQQLDGHGSLTIAEAMAGTDPVG